MVQLYGSLDGFPIARKDLFAGHIFFVPWHMASAGRLYGVALDVGSLILKVQQQPKLETRIRNGQFYVVRSRFLLGVRDVLMCVHVKYAPDLVILEVIVLFPASLTLSPFLFLDSVVNKSFGIHAARHDFDLHKANLQLTPKTI
jgi:hypothetical protein